MAITYSGLEETIIAFNKISDEKANDRVVTASKNAAQVVLKKAQELVPVGETGRLELSLEIQKVRARANKRYSRFVSQPVFTVGHRHVTLLGKAGVNYGWHVEFGHNIVVSGRVIGKTDAKPHLRPAADNTAGDVERILIDALEGELEGFTK